MKSNVVKIFVILAATAVAITLILYKEYLYGALVVFAGILCALDD